MVSTIKRTLKLLSMVVSENALIIEFVKASKANIIDLGFDWWANTLLYVYVHTCNTLTSVNHQSDVREIHV